MPPSGWRIALASDIGTSHVSGGSPCQDSARAVLMDAEGGHLLAAVVSDGAGSATLSDFGSQLICETFVELVALHVHGGGSVADITRDKCADWLGAIRTALIERAEEDGNHAREYSGTLLACVVGQDAAAFLQIGDGAIVIPDDTREKGWGFVFWPQHGEYANTTNFVTSDNALECFESAIIERHIEEIALFTDGIENLVLHTKTRTVFAPFFDKMFEPVRRAAEAGIDQALSDGLRRYLGQPHVCDRTDDDKTLVLATRRPMPVPGPETAECLTS